MSYCGPFTILSSGINKIVRQIGKSLQLRAPTSRSRFRHILTRKCNFPVSPEAKSYPLRAAFYGQVAKPITIVEYCGRAMQFEINQKHVAGGGRPVGV